MTKMTIDSWWKAHGIESRVEKELEVLRIAIGERWKEQYDKTGIWPAVSEYDQDIMRIAKRIVTNRICKEKQINNGSFVS